MCFFFLLMIRRPPRSTRTDTLFPYTTLFRSCLHSLRRVAQGSCNANHPWFVPSPRCRIPPRDRGFEPGKDLFMRNRSEEHTSELQSLMRISYAVFCLKKKKKTITYIQVTT